MYKTKKGLARYMAQCELQDNRLNYNDNTLIEPLQNNIINCLENSKTINEALKNLKSIIHIFIGSLMQDNIKYLWQHIYN